MCQQLRHLCGREYLDLALLHLVRAEALRRRLLVPAQPTFALGEVEQRNQQPAVIVSGDRPSVERAEILAQVLRLDRGYVALELAREPAEVPANVLEVEIAHPFGLLRLREPADRFGHGNFGQASLDVLLEVARRFHDPAMTENVEAAGELVRD